MARLLKVLIALSCAWNFILAGMDGAIMCLHSDGGLHVESHESHATNGSSDCHDEHACDSSVGEHVDCDPCTDIELRANDLGPVRLKEAAAAKLPALAVCQIALTPSPFGSPPPGERPAPLKAWPGPELGAGSSPQTVRSVVLRL